jgi:hypothetical protein
LTDTTKRKKKFEKKRIERIDVESVPIERIDKKDMMVTDQDDIKILLEEKRKELMKKDRHDIGKLSKDYTELCLQNFLGDILFLPSTFICSYVPNRYATICFDASKISFVDAELISDINFNNFFAV